MYITCYVLNTDCIETMDANKTAAENEYIKRTRKVENGGSIRVSNG